MKTKLKGAKKLACSLQATRTEKIRWKLTMNMIDSNFSSFWKNWLKSEQKQKIIIKEGQWRWHVQQASGKWTKVIKLKVKRNCKEWNNKNDQPPIIDTF